MTACLRSLSLEYSLSILSLSESGVLTKRLNTSHSQSSMLSSTVERLSGVRLDSGNTQEKQRWRDTLHYYTLHVNERLSGNTYYVHFQLK